MPIRAGPRRQGTQLQQPPPSLTPGKRRSGTGLDRADIIVFGRATFTGSRPGLSDATTGDLEEKKYFLKLGWNVSLSPEFSVRFDGTLPKCVHASINNTNKTTAHHQQIGPIWSNPLVSYHLCNHARISTFSCIGPTICITFISLDVSYNSYISVIIFKLARFQCVVEQNFSKMSHLLIYLL